MSGRSGKITKERFYIGYGLDIQEASHYSDVGLKKQRSFGYDVTEVKGDV